jgi:hypothetical protein
MPLPIKTQIPFWNMLLHRVKAKSSSRGNDPLFKKCTCYNGHIVDTPSLPRENNVVWDVKGLLWHNFDNILHGYLTWPIYMY